VEADGAAGHHDSATAASHGINHREKDMTTMRMALGITGALAIAPATAPPTTPPGTDAAPEPITVELLTPRSAFTDGVAIGIDVTLDGELAHELDIADPTHTVVARITVQPGAMFPWHTHPGPVIVNVTEGELDYVQADNCVERNYPTGTAFVDPGRSNVHTASNPGDGVTVLIATFFEVPAEGPMTITEGFDTPTCDVEVGMSH